ncbi:uncharacterized protein LOC131929791 [Physella acuta]|uniref:uncharacterized protein LOC131929791 n=1 Tax=Physella acuta TaxID=109671 RepID=UPI0027DE2737|nr:uncharacterized protein LOC131929791 [Physella acuta]
MYLKRMEIGKQEAGDTHLQSFEPPTEFNMNKFNNGRKFFKEHLFSCCIAMLFSLIIGMSIPDFLEALLFTRESDTPKKALKRYLRTFKHVASWHYDNVWEKNSLAQNSILTVNKIHNKVREDIKSLTLKKPLSQYDMGVVQSGFMGAVIMYSDKAGIKCSESDLDDYVYFWYGIGHLLGIDFKYNICSNGLSQAFNICKEIEHEIINVFLANPKPEYFYLANTTVAAFQGGSKTLTLFTLPVISAMFMTLKWTDLSFSDKVRYSIWKFIFFAVKHCSFLRRYINNRIEKTFNLHFKD